MILNEAFSENVVYLLSSIIDMFFMTGVVMFVLGVIAIVINGIRSYCYN